MVAQTGPRVLLAIAGAGILGIGLLFHIIALVTLSWELYDQEYQNSGLWIRCVQSVCTHYEVKSSKIKVCEAFAIIALLLGAGGLGLALIHSFMILTGKPKNLILPPLSALAGCLACVAVTIVVSVWCGRRHNGFAIGYSFILSIIGGVLMSGGGFFVFAVSGIQS